MATYVNQLSSIFQFDKKTKNQSRKVLWQKGWKKMVIEFDLSCPLIPEIAS